MQTITTISLTDLDKVCGGVDIGGSQQGDNGSACFDLNNPPAGQAMMGNPSPKSPAAEGVERYNKFYERYTGTIEAMNGIGGGAAVAGGAKPTPDIGF